MQPTYLGDGVYIKLDEMQQVVLTTGSHDDFECEDRIVLEPAILANFKNWLESFENAGNDSR